MRQRCRLQARGVRRCCDRSRRDRPTEEVVEQRPTETQNDERDEETSQHWIRIDAPMDLSYDNPVAMLGPGDLFGEMTCMSLYPRSATVRAETACTALEMLRNKRVDVPQRKHGNIPL